MDNEQKQQHREEFQKRLEAEGVDVQAYAYEEYARRKEDPASSPIIAENRAFETQIIETLQERDQKEEAEKRAEHDQLTGILNRRGYESRLAELQKKEEGKKSPHAVQRKADQQNAMLEEPFSMIAFDIDHFKRVNDAYGHAAGDEVLKEVARRVQNRIRAGDIFTRVGGEEFRVVILAANGSAPIVAEHLRRIIENRPFTVTRMDPETKEQIAVDIPITISLGVSPYFEDRAKMEKLSDQALYAAKNGPPSAGEHAGRGGRNQVWKWDKQGGELEPHEPEPPRAQV